MGRIKEISRKSAHTRKRNPVVYLICEGSETEIRYFKRFRSRGCNIDIIPISSQYKSADRLVQKAKATMGNNPYYPEDGDSIWCVFDRDDNSNEVLLRAKQSAQKEGYHLAYSNPSFELWFLLHFVNQQAEVEDCQALIRLLKQPGRLPDYEKNKDYFDVLKPFFFCFICMTSFRKRPEVCRNATSDIIKICFSTNSTFSTLTKVEQWPLSAIINRSCLLCSIFHAVR